MKIKIVVFFLIVFAHVNAQELVQDNDKTNAKFKIRNMGFNVEGKFNQVLIVSNFNKNKLSESFIKGLVTVNSIDTGNRKRDIHLIREDYFDSASFEHLKIESIKITKVENNSYRLTANLTIKETTKKVVIPIQVTETAKSVTISASFSLDRLDYKVGKSSWVLSDTVHIEVNYTGSK